MIKQCCVGTQKKCSPSSAKVFNDMLMSAQLIIGSTLENCVCVCLDRAHCSDGDFLFLRFPPHSSAISSCQHAPTHRWWAHADVLKKYTPLDFGHVSPSCFLSLFIVDSPSRGRHPTPMCFKCVADCPHRMTSTSCFIFTRQISNCSRSGRLRNRNVL